MELDDVKGRMDYHGNQKVDAKIKLDKLAENSEGVSFDDGMNVDSVFANYEDQFCTDHENGLKQNDAMLVDGQSSETVLDNGSGKATIMADEVPESAEGGADVISTLCGNGDPVSSCVSEFVEPATGESKDVVVLVVSNDASANENEASRHSDLVTDASLGIESGGKIHEIHKKLHMGSLILGTDTLNASITSSLIENSDAAPVSRKDTKEESEGHAAHPHSSLTDESLARHVNLGLECEPDVTFNNYAFDGAAQVDTHGKDQEMHDQDANANVSAADSTIAQSCASFRHDTNAHEQPSMGTEVMHAAPEDRKVNTSAPIQEAEATDVFIDVSEVMNSCTAPKKNDKEECEGCVADEQHLLLDESLVGGSGQEADTAVGECFIKGARDGIALDGINMEGQHVPIPFKQIEQPIEKFVNESSESDTVRPRNKTEENTEFKFSPDQHVELPDTSFPTQQVHFSQQVHEDSLPDSENPQSNGEENVKQEASHRQQNEFPERATFAQQLELPEEQVGEDPVCDSANSQNYDERSANNESTPTQKVGSPNTAVPAQPAEFPERQEVDEGPVFDSASPQSMDENNVRHESASSQQEMELPDTAVPTQQVELAEEQEEDRVSDSASPQRMVEDNTRNESIPIQQVILSEAALSSQQVVLPEEQAVDEDTVSDSENPLSLNEDDAGNGPTPTQQVESPETAVSTEQIEFPEAPEVDECPVPDSANTQIKFEKHAASVCTRQQVESPGTVVSTERVELPEEKEVDEDCASDPAKPRRKGERRGRPRSAKPGGSVSNHRVTYRLPPEDDSVFSVFDLVWGKVKSHPWWPGQIFHPSDSSEKAMKYYKKDCYLVAYFGDRTFAWNDASVLKSFRKHFSQEEKQSTTESFQNAVNCALSEVSRRVELGLTCSCLSEAAYDKIKYQIVENGGIREESSKRESIDRSSGPETFHSDKLVEYVRSLATSPTSGVDRLDLVIAKAQLLAFNRLKGCDALAEFKYFDGLTEFDANSLGESEFRDLVAADDDKTKLKGPRKCKHNLKDIVYQRRKGKSLTELMGESMYYLDGEFDSFEEDDTVLTSPRPGSKRKASDDFTTPSSTKAISFANVSHTVSSNPQESFKVGECIRRVASQLTGTSSSIMKCSSDGSDSKVIGDDVDEVIDAPPDDSVTESTMIPQKQSSPEEMVSRLHLSALDPMKGYNLLGDDIISFFYELRTTAVSAQRKKMRKGPGLKRKASAPAIGSPEAFEFDDKNDSYWTDMVVEKDSEAKPARRGRKRKENQVVGVDSEKSLQSKRRKYTKKQYFHESHEEHSPEVPARDEKLDLVPTELMLNFGDVGCILSEVNLNKMFRRFGPLKESETEIDAQSGRARLVFKKRSDAEVAYSSAAMFNVFGSSPVIYQLNYTPSAPFGSSPLALTDAVEHGT